MPDTDLSTIIEELRAVLSRHRVSGVLIVSRPPRANVALHFDADTTCLSLSGASLNIDTSQTGRFVQTACTLVGFCKLVTGVGEDLDGILVQLTAIRGFTSHLQKASDESPFSPAPPAT